MFTDSCGRSTSCFIPSHRVQAHEKENWQEFTLLVMTTKDVNDPSCVEWDEHLTWDEKQTHTLDITIKRILSKLTGVI